MKFVLPDTKFVFYNSRKFTYNYIYIYINGNYRGPQGPETSKCNVMESNDARAQSAKSEPSHVHPAKQTKPTPGSSLQRLDQVRSLEINDVKVKSTKIRPSHVDTHK